MSDLAKTLDALFQPWNRSDVPGLIVGVARRGQTVYRRGFGLASVEHQTLNTPRTRMRIGSTSKHFAALAVLLLAEDGRLDPDAPLRRYLTELGGPVGEPTLRQLMQHSGGLRDPYDLPGLLLCGGFPTLLGAGAGLALSQRFTSANFAPGERMVYCNNGYHLLSLVVELLSGLRFADFLRQRILDPLGMHDTALLPSDLQMLPGIASFHLPQADGSWRRGIYPSEELLGSGGMVSSLDDMLRWLAHLRGTKTVGSEASWAQMLERPRYSSGATGDYCLGLIRETYRGLEIVHHAGAVLGCNSQMLCVPEQALDVIVIFNRMDGNASGMALKVVDAVLTEAGLAPPPTPVPVPVGQYPALIGRWYSPTSRRLYGVLAHPGEDAAPVLALSVQQQTMGLLRPCEGGLRMSSPAHGSVELRLPDPGDEPAGQLQVIDSGHAETCTRLPATGPDAVALAPELLGRYRYADFDRELVMVLDEGVLYLDLCPAYGQSRLQLEPFSDEVCGLRLGGSFPIPVPTSGCLTIQREQGRVSGLWLGGGRSRDIWLARCDPA